MRPVLSCVIDDSHTCTHAQSHARCFVCTDITNKCTLMHSIYTDLNVQSYIRHAYDSLSLSLSHTHTHTHTHTHAHTHVTHTHTHVNQIIHHPYLRHACVRTGSGVTVAGNDRFRCVLVITSRLALPNSRISQHKPSIRQHTSEYL
jgi:hypothetical protein